MPPCACRALGDSDYKKPDQGVTANAEVRRVDMVMEDRAVIMGSDGLWDVLGDQEVVDTVEEVFKVSQEGCVPGRQSPCGGMLPQGLGSTKSYLIAPV